MIILRLSLLGSLLWATRLAIYLISFDQTAVSGILSSGFWQVETWTVILFVLLAFDRFGKKRGLTLFAVLGTVVGSLGFLVHFQLAFRQTPSIYAVGIAAASWLCASLTAYSIFAIVESLWHKFRSRRKLKLNASAPVS